MTWSHRLTPSELLLFNGSPVVEKGSWWSFTNRIQVLIPGTKKKVSARELGMSMAVAAILANEDVGTITLSEKRRQSGWDTGQITMALVPRKHHLVQYQGWPVPSLEHAVCAGSRRSSPEVQRIFYDWLGEDSGHPWTSLIERVESFLAERGFMIETRRKTLFRTAKYTLSDRADFRVEESVIRAIGERVAWFRSTAPDAYSALLWDLDRAMSRRTIRGY